MFCNIFDSTAVKFEETVTCLVDVNESDTCAFLGTLRWLVPARRMPEFLIHDHLHAQANRGAAPGLLAHSDWGSQYASADHREVLLAWGFLQSISRNGNRYDNAAMESFFSTLTIELA